MHLLTKMIFGTIAILCAFVAHAQVSEDFSFLGTLISNEEVMMTYKLDIKIVGNVVVGESTMDIDGPNQTSSLLSGSYNIISKMISFKETSIKSSKASLGGTFCFIGGNAVLSVRNKKSQLIGSFWGLIDDKDTCAEGRLSMVATSYIMNKMKKAEKIVRKLGLKDSILLANTDSKVLEKSLNVMKVSKTETANLKWTSEQCILKVWDDDLVDGDIINIKVNGIYVLYNYILAKEAKSINLVLEPGDNLIEIEAVNNGDRIPNTANIVIEEVASITKLVSYLNKGEVAKIQLTR
jgi:hypothetical protein